MIAHSFAQRIAQALSHGPNETLHLHEPQFDGSEQDLVLDCLKSTFVSSVGAYVGQFENDLCQATGSQHAIATVNGTAALHLCLKAVGVQPEDHVLVPSLTFVATINAISYLHATPHFVDNEPDQLGVDPVALRQYLSENCDQTNGVCRHVKTNKVIRALVVMHTFGHIGKMDELVQLCQDFNIALVEDAAESLGSSYRGKPMGSWGICSALSFNGNKIITTGGGGAVLCRDQATAQYIRHISTTAKKPHPWLYDHDEIGHNYRMPNLNAALGVGQLRQLPKFLTQKQKLHEHYRSALLGSDVGVSLFVPPAECQSNHWLNAAILNSEHAHLRDDMLQACHDLGIMVRPVWKLCHRLPMFEHCPSMPLSVAEDLEQRLINLPSSAILSERC